MLPVLPRNQPERRRSKQARAIEIGRQTECADATHTVGLSARGCGRGPSWTYYNFPKHSSRILPLSLEKIIPISRNVPIFVSLGVVVEAASLVCFRIVRGDDFVTPATDVLFCVSDHDSPLFVLRADCHRIL